MLVKTKEIDRIIFKFPELMNRDSEELIRGMLNNLEETKEKLHKARTKVWELEREVEKKEENIRGMRSLFDVEYKTQEVADKVHGECNMIIDNPTDARHLNYGKN